MLFLLFSRAAFAWNGPADETDWVALTRAGATIDDPFDDHDRDGEAAPDAIDCVGDTSASAPALYWHATLDYLSFRVRVDDSPWLDETDGDLLPINWSFLIDTDANDLDFEYVISVDGISPSAQLWENAADEAGVVLSTITLNQYVDDDPLGTYVQIVEAGSNIHTVGDWFVDVAFPVSSLPTSAFLANSFRVAVVSNNATTPTEADNDLCGFDDSTTLGELSDVWSDAIGIDQDMDGRTDLEEADFGTDETDGDTDDDGLTDGQEYNLGTDPFICDSDADHLPDGLEAGVVLPYEGTDPLAGCFVADADSTTTTSPMDGDTDLGSVNDGDEDRNRNGKIDAWETDPNDPTDDVDTDGDGLADVVEAMCDLTGTDDDQDGDGQLDEEEGYEDTDGDGRPDFCDDDDDGDSVPTIDESENDGDDDGLDDYLDPDSDNNGTPDADELDTDVDCDATVDAYDVNDSDGPCGDPDGDGQTNEAEQLCGSNPANADTDGDGVSDAVESCDDDIDCDQLPDRLDAETDPAGCDEGDSDPPVEKDECDGDEILCGGNYTGGSCAVGPGAGAMAIFAAGWFAVGRRRRKVLLLGGLSAGTAAAAEPTLNAQRYQPALDSQTFLSIYDSRVGPGGFGGGVGFNYAQSPLRYTYDDPETAPVELLGSAATFDLGVGYAWKPLAFSISLPLHVVDGDRIDGQFTPGDLRIGARAELLRRDKIGFGLGLFGGVGLPTGNEKAWVGAPSPEGTVGLSLAAGKSVVVAANAGVRLTETSEFLPDLDWGNRFAWGTGVSVPIGDLVRVIGEVDGELSLDSTDAIGSVPMEWRAGARANLTRNLVASAGFGTGLTTGIGAPAWRLTTGISWQPAEKLRPTPQPTPPAPIPQVVNVDPLAGTVIVTAQNGAGQPLASLVTILGEGRKFTTGPDGIGTERVAAGEIELSVWSEGYRPTRQKVAVEAGKRASVSITLEPSRVMVLADRVDIRDKIFFEFDSATITAESFAVLDDLAGTLDNHVEIELVEVQGHTDDQGAEEYNLKLSQSRAEAVRQYLVTQGIAPDRLIARGYGESQPLQPGDTVEAREVNRRVVFKIVKGTKLPEGKPATPERGPKKGRTP